MILQCNYIGLFFVLSRSHCKGIMILIRQITITIIMIQEDNSTTIITTTIIMTIDDPLQEDQDKSKVQGLWFGTIWLRQIV